MTHDEILTKEAGREMDELITKQIVSNDGFWHGIKHYSTNIAAAFEVLDKFTDYEIEKAGKNYRVLINGFVSAASTKLPEAAMRAALLATLEKEA